MKEKLKSILKRSPLLYRFFQKYYWKFNQLRAFIFGTKLEEKRWSQKHFNSEIDLNDLNHPHRQLLIEKISEYQPKSIFEIVILNPA